MVKENTEVEVELSPLEQLKVDLDEKIAARKAMLTGMMEERKIQRQIEQVESPLYEKRFMEEEDNKKLDAFIAFIEDMYAENRRKVSQVFGFGVIANKMLIIVQAIQYSKIDEKHELLALTGLTEQLVEDIVEAYGATAYFSAREMEIKEAIPMDTIKIKELLKVAAFDMGLVSDLNLVKFNHDNVENMYKRAAIRAEEMYDNTVRYSDVDVDYTE